jgi:hypothetical protein
MKKEKIIRRLSIGLTRSEWKLFSEAAKKRYFVQSSKPIECCMTRYERSHFLQLALAAVCRAALRQPRHFILCAFACDLREETAEEAKQRLAEGKTSRARITKGQKAQAPVIGIDFQNRLKKYFDGTSN